MAETLLSPGALARENDQSQITQGPVEVGAAIVGPTSKGPVEIPTIVTSFSEYTSTFGSTVESGSNVYSYLTSVSANNYFQNGGSSLLVTRVTSGSFSPSNSTTIQNNVGAVSAELFGSLLGDLTSGGTAGTAGTYAVPDASIVEATGVAAGVGSGVSLSVVMGDTTKLIATQDVLSDSALSGGTTIGATAGPITVAANLIVTSGGSTQVGTGATISITTDGAGAAGVLTAVAVVAAGSGYVTGNVLTISAANMETAGFIGCDRSVTFTLDTANLLVGPTTINVVDEGTGYFPGNTLTIPTGAIIGSPTADLVITITGSSLINQNSFVLETLSEGVIMNNEGTEGTNNTLPLGTVDNVRWEITSANTSSGTFSLLVRRGNDSSKQKVVLESYNNLSLDPYASNYISKVIGDIDQNLRNEGTDYYIQESGSYPNTSRYVRVKSVNAPTPNYFDNAGGAKEAFKSYIPVVSSGSFEGGVGSNIPTGRPANFYSDINGTDTQGLIGPDYNNAIALLSNTDEYQFNLISAPGLTSADHSTQTTSLVNNSVFRGDNIAVVDLVGYGAKTKSVITQAASFDNSYAAAYWPWVQTVDPNTGQLQFVPASTMMSGVYAYTDASSEPWFAPAGITRGGLGQVVKAERKLTAGQRDSLYEANVNPIATFPAQGVVVFGQKTLQKRASALDRVNVRRLLISLKSYISQVSDTLVFEQNSIATRNNFLSQVNPYLESVQQRQGLYAFKVVMDDTNNTADVIDRNELLGQIFLQPTKTAEFIILDFNVLPTGATFPS